jgi:parvulin-like peptidyl-prolyl isomerase
MVRVWFLAGGVCLSLAGCGHETLVDLAPDRAPPEKTLVTVNGEPISLDTFDNEFRLMEIHYSAVTEGDMRAIKRRLFEQVINRRLLLQEARRVGLKMTQQDLDDAFQKALREIPDDYRTILKTRGVGEEAWKRKVLQEKLAQKIVDQEVDSRVQVTRAEVEEYYWSHLSQYWVPAAVRARHLVTPKRADLEKALESLKRGEDFAKVAATFSQGMEKAQGGDWGWMQTDRLPPDYLALLSGLGPGGISKPVKDEFGCHLFQLIGWRPRRMRTLAEAAPLIHDFLLKEEQDMRFDQWMAGLKKMAVIKVNQDLAPIVGVTLEGLRDE